MDSRVMDLPRTGSHSWRFTPRNWIAWPLTSRFPSLISTRLNPTCWLKLSSTSPWGLVRVNCRL